MAIDTAILRESALLDVMITPDGTVTPWDRKSLLGQYAFAPDWSDVDNGFNNTVRLPVYNKTVSMRKYETATRLPVFNVTKRLQ